MWCTQKLVCQIFWRLRATMSKLFPKANKEFFWDETGPPWQSHWNWPCRERFPLKWRILKVSMLFNARFWPLQSGGWSTPTPQIGSNLPNFSRAKIWKNIWSPTTDHHLFALKIWWWGEAPVRAPHHVSPLRSNSMGLYTPGAWWTLPLVPFCFVVESWNYFPCDTDGKWNRKGWPKFWIITLGLASSEKQVQLQWSNYIQKLPSWRPLIWVCFNFFA